MLIPTELAQSPTQQTIIDRKKQRHALIEKREGINKERTAQQVERKELLAMLEQLLSLETRLNQEMKGVYIWTLNFLVGYFFP